MSMQLFVLLAAMAASISAQAFTINTPPSVQQCLPVQLTWTGGKPPVYISLIPGGQPGGAMIKDFGPQNGNSLTWVVDQPAGTSLTVQARDSDGVLNYSDKFTVQPGGTSCPTGSAGGAAGGAAAPGGAPPSSSPSASNSSSTKPPGAGSAPTPSTGNANNSTSKPSGSTTSPSSGSGSTPSPTSGASSAAAVPGPSGSSSTPPSTGASTSDASRALPGVLALGLAGFFSLVL